MRVVAIYNYVSRNHGMTIPHYKMTLLQKPVLISDYSHQSVMMALLIHDIEILRGKHQTTKRYWEGDILWLFTCLAPSQEEKCPNKEKREEKKKRFNRNALPICHFHLQQMMTSQVYLRHKLQSRPRIVMHSCWNGFFILKWVPVPRTSCMAKWN